MKTLPLVLILSLLHLTYGQYIRAQRFIDATCEGEVFHTLFETVQCHKHEDEISMFHYFTYGNNTITEYACFDANCENCTQEFQTFESVCINSMHYTYVSNISETDGDEKCEGEPILEEQYASGCSSLEDFSFLTECGDELTISSCSLAECSTTNNTCIPQSYPLECTYNDVYDLWIMGKCPSTEQPVEVLMSFPAVLLACFVITALGLFSGGFIWWMHTRGEHTPHKELKEEKEEVEMS